MEGPTSKAGGQDCVILWIWLQGGFHQWLHPNPSPYQCENHSLNCKEKSLALASQEDLEAQG